VPGERATGERATGERAIGERAAEAVAGADALWERRAEGQRGGRPAEGPIGSAVAAYERLLAADPGSLRLRWKLARALYFQGEYAVDDPDRRLDIFERGRELADEGREALLAAAGLEASERDPEIVAGALAGAPDAVQTWFYSAVHWGLWGRSTGRMKAARQGVAARVRDYAATVVLLDERFADAGGLRFLGRLHTEAPRIPLVTGWIDRERAVGDLDRACALAPESPENQVFLADALLRFAGERRAEALGRLERVLERGPRASSLVEDLAALADAKELLDRYGDDDVALERPF
jgi:tetratricopeptide (TPR) repeat protein